ncbi:MAG: (2Fe-2S)-binding protein [Chloroflexi bacterium]|nr:(2Fe-2S)-binding protein [Chloroflexota bacterium]
MRHAIRFTVNGEAQALEVEPHRTLLDVLREDLHLTGAKEGCDAGDCGVCTIILDGKAVNPCLILAVEARGKEITTIEGLARDERLHPLQEEFIRQGAVQCGFCSPGMILTAKALLAENPQPTAQEVREAIAGNLCRCTGYESIVRAILSAAPQMAGR